MSIRQGLLQVRNTRETGSDPADLILTDGKTTRQGKTVVRRLARAKVDLRGFRQVFQSES